MALYQKHRPNTFEDVVGNQETISTLSTMVRDKETCPHAFLLTGPTGCGKTTIGRIIVQELGCSEHDYKEVDSADFRGIDTIRDIRKQSRFRPMAGEVKVWLIDECHKMTGDAQNALLKILEDTPKHVFFILATTDPQKLIPTIKGRCSTFAVKPLGEKEMKRLLRRVAKEEVATDSTGLTKEIYEQIVMDSLGHPRNALQILEQVLRTDPEKRLEVARRAAEEQSQSIELCRALLKGPGTSWKEVATILQGLKDQDAESIRRHVLGYCQSVLLRGSNDQAAKVIEEFWEPLYNIGFPGLVYACYSSKNG